MNTALTGHRAKTMQQRYLKAIWFYFSKSLDNEFDNKRPENGTNWRTISRDKSEVYFSINSYANSLSFLSLSRTAFSRKLALMENKHSANLKIPQIMILQKIEFESELKIWAEEKWKIE